ncbi:ABC transporter ATP-binding protein [Rossellomorea aquimaris]|nr:ABC transporter ATP-binding protein [Rossellomorea aquimaris]WRP06589.1 ABC transporter ATP-binding protein [Rossellomorea aquimaris]
MKIIIRMVGAELHYIKLNSVTKKLNKKKILDEVSFNIPKGEITAFLGPNGAGKTTTLKILSGLLDYDDGEILINNQNFKKHTEEVMFIPDIPFMYPELTGREFIDFTIDLFNVRIKPQEIEDFIKKFKLENEVHKQISQHSFGTKKKIALLTTLIKRPNLLLLDEFISGIDPVNLKTIKDILIDYSSEGNTVFISTHQLEVVQSFCHNVILLNNGRIINDILKIRDVLESNHTLEDYFINQIEVSEGIEAIFQ